MFPRVNGV